MFGEQASTLILDYNFRKKSGLSSGGRILPFPPLFWPGFRGLPAINQAISPKILVKTIINNQAHFGNLRTFSCGVIAQSTNV